MRGYSALVDAASGPWPARHALANRTATAPGCGRARWDVDYGEASVLGSCKRDGRQKGDGWESMRDLLVSLMDDNGGAGVLLLLVLGSRYGGVVVLNFLLPSSCSFFLLLY